MFSPNLRASFSIKKPPLIELQPVLPENRLVERSNMSSGILPAAVSEASTGINCHLPCMVAVSCVVFTEIVSAEVPGACMLDLHVNADKIRPIIMNRFIPRHIQFLSHTDSEVYLPAF